MESFLVLIAIGSVTLPLVAERNNYKFIWSVWRRFRIKMLFECLGIFLLTIIVSVVLAQIPGLKYGWLGLFFGGESGNMLIKPVMEGSKSTNILIRSMVPVFFIALMLALPFLAQAEEMFFRKSYNDWGSIIKKSIEFGLVHCLVGIPLAGGIALIIPGLFLGLKYKHAFDRNENTIDYSEAVDEAVMVSTTYHTMSNTIGIMILLTIALVSI